MKRNSVLLTMLNCVSVRGVTWVQNVLTVAKLAALVLVIITGIVALIIGGRELHLSCNHNQIDTPNRIL